MDKTEKIKRLKEVLPIFWSSYQHMYDARERKTKGMIDFLLIISTFLPLLSVGLYSTKLFDNPLILLPILPQLISIIILLKYFIVDSPFLVWVKCDKPLLKEINNEDFEINLISILKKLEEQTGISMKKEGVLIKQARLLILISLFILLFSASFILFKLNIIFYFLTGILIVSFCFIYFLYYKKGPDFSNADKIEEETKKLIKTWLNK